MSAVNCESDVVAQHLYDGLVSAGEFDVPTVNLSDPQFANPDFTGNDLIAQLSRLTEADLTSRSPEGSGLFDGLMESIKAHLNEEHTSNRITSKEYADTYVALTSAALGNAVQFLLSRDQAYYQSVLVQKQAEVAAIQAVTARVELEKAKAELISVQADAKTRAAQYVHTMIMAAGEDAKRCLTEKQSSVAQAQYDQTLYETAQILPANLANINADTNTKVYTHDNLMPAQLAGITADTAAKTYTNSFILPEQLENLREQVEAQRAKTLDTRTDGITAVAGSIGKQKELHQQQIDSYKRDAEWKVAKGILDTWITQKSLDEGLVAPTALNDGNINSIMSAIRTNLSI